MKILLLFHCSLNFFTNFAVQSKGKARWQALYKLMKKKLKIICKLFGGIKNIHYICTRNKT
jgi:hypothetical protein